MDATFPRRCPAAIVERAFSLHGLGARLPVARGRARPRGRRVSPRAADVGPVSAGCRLPAETGPLPGHRAEGAFPSLPSSRPGDGIAS